MKVNVFHFTGELYKIINILLLLSLLIICPTAYSSDQLKIAVVLSGGGARGLAQIGVLKAFDEAGIRPDIIVANSMGAIIGSLYAIGLSPDSIAQYCKSIDWNSFYENSAKRDYLFVSQKAEPLNYHLELRFDYDLTPILPRSISHGQSFYDYFAPIFVAPQFHADMNFDSLQIPLRIVATDILTGERVSFSKGNLAAAVRASCSVPIAFSPVAHDSMLLVDGGITANIPVEPAREENPDYVIAVNGTSPMWKKSELQNPLHLADQIVAIGIKKQKARELKLADYVVAPKLEGFLNTEFKRLDSLILLGYETGKEHVPAIKSALAQIQKEKKSTEEITLKETLKYPIFFDGVDSSCIKELDSIVKHLSSVFEKEIPIDSFKSSFTLLCKRKKYPFGRIEKIDFRKNGTHILINPGKVRAVKVKGNLKTSKNFIKSLLACKKGKIVTEKKISQSISSLYASNLFENVNIDVDSSLNVIIHVVEKKYLRTRAALRYDEFHLGEGYIQPAYENLFGEGICLSMHLQYGLRREKYALELASNRPLIRKLANMTKIQTYISREKIRETVTEESPDTSVFETYFLQEQTLRKAGIIGLFGANISNFAMIEAGVRIEQFKVHQSDRSIFADPLSSFRDGIRHMMLRLTVDNMDRFPFPLKGGKHYINIGGAYDAIGGTESFFKADGSGCYYFTVADRHTLAPKLHLSWSSKRLPDVERIFLGGALPQEKYRDIGIFNYISFNGLPPRGWSGDAVFLLEGTYRFLIREDLYFVSTVNWGYAWDKADFAFSSQTLKDYLKEAPIGIGIGLALETLIGPIRFSWGRLLYNVETVETLGIANENRFYFSIGHDF